MKRFIFALLLLSLLRLQAAPVPQAPASRVSIDGIVISARGGEPIEGAQVTVTRGNVAAIDMPAAGHIMTTPVSAGAIPIVTTDPNGKFVIKDLASGEYRIAIVANGYARQDYGQRVFPGSETGVLSAAPVHNLVIRLTPTGTVSGRIRDLRGNPLAGVPVQLIKYTYSASGLKTFHSAGAARTDDRGEYRLYWVTPGRYYLSGGSGPGPSSGRSPEGTGSPNEILTPVYAATYFPGVADLDRASLVEVRPGTELTAMDFVVSRPELRKVRGRIIDSRTGQPPRSVSIGLTYRNLTGGTGSFSGAQSYDPISGIFELRNIVPGPYVIQATVQESTISTGAQARNTARPIALSSLTVSEADIENVFLLLIAPVSIAGRITVESSGASIESVLNHVGVQLRPFQKQNSATIGFNAPQTQPMTVDGSFRVDGLVPGEYMVSLASGLPTDFYLKSARFLEMDVLNNPMQFSGSAGGTLEIVISSKSARVDGRVIDDKRQPVSGAVTVLIPNTQRDRFDFYKTAATDLNGSFTFRGIPPGDYKIFSWEALDSFAFYDPEVLKLFEQNGKPVHVSESSREIVEVPVISEAVAR